MSCAILDTWKLSSRSQTGWRQSRNITYYRSNNEIVLNWLRRRELSTRHCPTNHPLYICALRVHSGLCPESFMLYRGDDPIQDRSTKNRPVFGLGSSFVEPQVRTILPEGVDVSMDSP